MSIKYDEYLKEHIENVKKGAEWMIKHGIVYGRYVDILRKLVNDHDKSKFTNHEYDPYDEYFYGTRTEDVKRNFDYAWLHHIHENKHHWQYWVLIGDDDGTKALKMPEEYVYEMIADWWAFSWKNGNLFEIFNWYADHSEKMILHEETRRLVDKILDRIDYFLIEDDT